MSEETRDHFQGGDIDGDNIQNGPATTNAAVSTESTPSMTGLRKPGDDDSLSEEERHKQPPINPLITMKHLELDVLEKSYARDSGSADASCDDSDTYSSKASSPSRRRRSSVFQPNIPIPDDFIVGAMLSIRTSVLSKYSTPTLDFQSSAKYKISMAGDRKVQVKDFAQPVFEKLRLLFGVSTQAYLLSWSDSRLTSTKTAGRSDSMFVCSPDKRFILKTMSKSEAKRLRKFLQTYYEYMSTQPDTLLVKIFGIHRIDYKRGQQKIYFTVMSNVFDVPWSMSEVYDLKGSSVGRKTSLDKKSSPNVVLKDLDMKGRKICIKPECKAQLLNQIKQDSQFLSKNNLMDYSLLLGIHKTNDTESFDVPAPVSSDEKLPSLLFFLESSKAPRPTPPNPNQQHKIFRRKSVTLGGGRVLALQQEAGEDSDNTDSEQSNSKTSSPAVPDDIAERLQEESEQSGDGEKVRFSSKFLRSNSIATQVMRGRQQAEEDDDAEQDPLEDPDQDEDLDEPSELDTTPRAIPKRHITHVEEDVSTHVPFFKTDCGGIRSFPVQTDSPSEVYYVGIIDFLQKYNRKKKIAHLYKSLKHEKEELSTVEPAFYMNRFLKMVEKTLST